jgi:hypothetical protein
MTVSRSSHCMVCRHLLPNRIGEGVPVIREQRLKATLMRSSLSCTVVEITRRYLLFQFGHRNYCRFAYSVLACFKMGTSGSASFQRVMKSSYADFALALTAMRT